MNKSKYITYTTMALVAFIIVEMILFTFMFVKGQDEKEYKFEYGTVMDVRGALGIKFLIETESGKRIFVYSNKTLSVGDKVIVKEYKEKYCLSSEKEKSSYNTENKISDTEDKRNDRRICCGRSRWCGIIQQYKKILSELSEPKKTHRGNRILLPECGVHDYR